MLKKFLATICILTLCSSTYAFEDCIISTDAKLTDITIEHNDIIDVFPLITIMNEKNTLIIHPLKVGESRLGIVKGEKETIVFNVKVTEDSTIIDSVKGFDILTLDCPPGYFEYELDEPPGVNQGVNHGANSINEENNWTN